MAKDKKTDLLTFALVGVVILATVMTILKGLNYV
jgi:hypothetical protein